MRSNAEKGRNFLEASRPILEKALGVKFNTEVAIPIGQPPKPHKFDLASVNHEWFIECKDLAWRANGKTPQAKITSVTEAAQLLQMLSIKCRKAVVMNRATHSARYESLAEYYARLHQNLLGGIALGEIDLTLETLRWLTLPEQ